MSYDFCSTQQQHIEVGFQDDECQNAQFQKQVSDVRCSFYLLQLGQYFTQNNVTESTSIQLQDMSCVDQSQSKNSQYFLSINQSDQSCNDYPQQNNQNCGQSEDLDSCQKINTCPSSQEQIEENIQGLQIESQSVQQCNGDLQLSSYDKEFEPNQFASNLTNPTFRCSNDNNQFNTVVNQNHNNLCQKKYSLAKQKAIQKNKNAYSDTFTCKVCKIPYASHAGITYHVKTNHPGKKTWQLQVKPNRQQGRPKSKNDTDSFKK